MAVSLYTEHFGLTGQPFTMLPDPGMLFWSQQHRRAFAVLEYGLVTQAPITVVTGEVGTGKTTLIQALLRQVDDDTRIGLISNAQGGRGDLLRWVLNALDVPVPPDVTDYVALFQAFQDHAVAEYAAGRHIVLIIDEAQNLGVDLLEELRMLTNINSGRDTVLQLILVGQPELRELITRPELRQFAQRVNAAYHINPMDADTTAQYIEHRLKAVGGSGTEIAPEATALIHAETGGIPRLVNKMCDLALIYAAAEQIDQVTSKTVDELIRDGILLVSRETPIFLTNRDMVRAKAAE